MPRGPAPNWADTPGNRPARRTSSGPRCRHRRRTRLDHRLPSTTRFIRFHIRTASAPVRRQALAFDRSWFAAPCRSRRSCTTRPQLAPPEVEPHQRSVTEMRGQACSNAFRGRSSEICRISPLRRKISALSSAGSDSGGNISVLPSRRVIVSVGRSSLRRR